MSGGGVVLDPVAPVEDRLREVCGHLNVLQAQLVELAAEALATGSWQGHGVRSLTHWLTWQAGITSGHASQVARLAEARQSHPVTMAVFADGGLSMDQTAIATTAPTYLDATFAEQAQVATIAQLRMMVRAARPAAPAPSPVEPPVESLSGWFDDDGRYHLSGDLDPDHGRIVDDALTEARDALLQAGHTNVTWADALVEMANRSLDAIATPARRERYRVNWFLDPTAPVPARWSDGIAIPDWLRDHLLCDGTISPTSAANGHPVSVGRTVRDLPDRTRRLVLHRDLKCRVPGCAQTRWLQVHHIVHRHDGGGHDTTNLIALCPADHRAHHQRRLGITGNADDPDGLTFTDANGEVIDPATRPSRPTRPPPPPPKRRYEHPLGERLQRWAVIYPDPPPATADHAA